MKLLSEAIHIQPGTDIPIYLQVSNAFIHQIRRGILRRGLKLPGTREVAGLLKINRMTAVAAYNELHAQGWIEMIPRKGAFVNKELPDVIPGKITNEPAIFNMPDKPLFPYNAVNIVPYPVSDFPEAGKLVLNDGFPDPREVPTEELIRAMRSLSRRHTFKRQLMYGGNQGTTTLREALTQNLSDTRGLPVSRENVLITRGAQMGIYLAARVLLEPGDHVLVGEPNYFGANLSFQQLGAQIKRVPVDEEGLNIEAVEELCKSRKIKLVYVIPHHHNPTTVTLTPERRVKLLELARRFKFAIIEDDYDYDFHYASKPMMPMASLDRHGSVIYIGTLSKTLAPAIRIGFMVAPKNFIQTALHLRKTIDTQGDSLLENAIAELYKDGTMARHIKRSVKLYKDRRDHFCGLLHSEVAEHVSFRIPDGGMSVWTRFTRAEVKMVSRLAREKGLVMHDGSDYDRPNFSYNSVRLGFASLNFDEQIKAVKILQTCLSGKN